MDGPVKHPLIKSFVAALLLHVLLFAAFLFLAPPRALQVVKPAFLAVDFMRESINKKTDCLSPQKQRTPVKKKVLSEKKQKKNGARPVKKKPALKQEEPSPPSEMPPIQQESGFAAAPVPQQKQDHGTGAEKAHHKKEINDFLAKVLLRIEKAKYYPVIARRKGMTGTVTCHFTVLRDGSVHGISVIRPSKYALLNRAAVQAVAKGIPYPKFPSFFKDDIFAANVDIKFHLN